MLLLHGLHQQILYDLVVLGSRFEPLVSSQHPRVHECKGQLIDEDAEDQVATSRTGSFQRPHGEVREQFDRKVLESDEYYNGHIQVRVHGSHIKIKT